MTALLLAPVLLQMVAMAFDEGVFHRRRGLPRWERIGHPLDTATVALAYAWLVFTSPTTPHALPIYVALSVFSCLFVTKDEFVHAKVCSPAEGWLHSVLFVLHPVVFLAFGLLWWRGDAAWILRGQLVMTVLFALYQVFYWSVFWNPNPRTPAR
ncbi:MAG: hypothetical protein HOO96_29455 [Polyangiaceae bacterium]|nr:hypothetical protein [Polyangiaceae bacterium]